jgi:hypothetical protein
MARPSRLAAFKNPLVPFFVVFLVCGDKLAKKPTSIGASPSHGADVCDASSDVELAVSIVRDDAESSDDTHAEPSTLAESAALESAVLDGVNAALAEVERNGGVAGRHARLAPTGSNSAGELVVVDLTDRQSEPSLLAAPRVDERLVLSYESALHASSPSRTPDLASFAAYLATRRRCDELATRITSASSSSPATAPTRAASRAR